MIAAALVVALLLVPMGGSDDPTPYTVDAAGITLPAGHAFVDGGHVNIRTTSGSYGIHFEALNNQPSGEWIGTSFLPWSAFGIDPATACIEWVQVAEFNEHFGEGGQTPVGAGCETAPTPTASPTATASPAPSQTPVPSASPTASPAPSASPTQGPQPAAEGTGPTSVPLPSDYSTPAPRATAIPTPVLAETGGTGTGTGWLAAAAGTAIVAGLAARFRKARS